VSRTPPLTDSSTSPPLESTSATENREVVDSIPQYACPISREVDLEGISLDDGFGYTVTITGPPAPKRRLLSRMSDSHQPDPEKGTEDDAQKLQISTTSAYSVDESYREVRPEQRARRKAAAQDADGIDQASQNLSAWGLLDRTASESSGKAESGGAAEQRPQT
jgi:hypothetical protein